MATRDAPAAPISGRGGAIDPATARTWLGQMLLIRRFEEKAAELYSAGKIRGFLHLSIGEEAVSVAAIGRAHRGGQRRLHLSRAWPRAGPRRAARRGHGGALRQGERRRAGDGAARCTSSTRGAGSTAATPSSAGGLPLAVGLALADRLLARDPRSPTCLFGDGAVAEGEFHESLNLASLWHLPVLFLCENNYYAMGTALERHQAETDISLKGAAYRIPSAAVDGMDVRATAAEAVRQAVDEVRGGDGPFLLECRTYRFRAHSMYDPELYRSKEEVEQWKQRDPIALFRARLEQDGILTAGGDGGARPGGPGRDGAGGGLRGGGGVGTGGGPAQGRLRRRAAMRMTYREAMRTALREALSDGPAGVPHGRGRGPLRRRLRGEQGAARAVRPGPGAGHAALGVGLRRRGHRGGAGRHAADRGGHDRQLQPARARPGGEHRRDPASHVRRPARRAAGGAHGHRSRAPGCGAALAQPRGLVRAHPRHQRAWPPPRLTMPGGCCPRRSGSRTRCSSSSTRCSTPRRGRSGRSPGRCRSSRRPSAARAGMSP